MAQWINIGNYFFKWLSDLFSYCGGSCVCGFLFVADFGSRAFELSNSKKWNSKNSIIPDWLINPGKSLQIQLRAIAYRQIINHGASRTHFWSFKNFQDRYRYVSLLYRYSRHLSWLNWHCWRITWLLIQRTRFYTVKSAGYFNHCEHWLHWDAWLDIRASESSEVIVRRFERIAVSIKSKDLKIERLSVFCEIGSL